MVSLPEEINSADQAIKIFADGSVHSSLAEAIMYIREAADELESDHIQKLLPTVSEYIDKFKPNERTLGSIIDMLQDVCSKTDITALKLRELIRLVISPLCRLKYLKTNEALCRLRIRNA